MSRIYFHSSSETREIYGRERAWMGRLTDDLARGLTINHFNCLELAQFLLSDAYPLSEREPQLGSALRFERSLSLWMRDSDNDWLVDGQPYNCWQMSLNTCLVVGNDAMKLCARLHGQCEIHAYVEGPHRPWLAGIIRHGVRCGLMRDGGTERERGQWTRLADWLEGNTAEPVVTSYSVCDQFPNRHVAEVEDDEDGNLWYSFPADARWNLAIAKLRENGPELKPEGWEDYRFGHCKDAFWLHEQLRKG